MRNPRRIAAILFVLLLTVLFTAAVSADFGPKDRLDIYLTNPPDGVYYLDLLYDAGGADVYENLTAEEVAGLNEEMLAALRDNGTGWTAAMAVGTRVPLFGKLTGNAEADTVRHTFSYYGLPETYRIIIVTESGETHISDPFTRRAMQSSITYDYAAGTGEIPPLWHQYLSQFACTCLATLLIEGILLLLFRFSLRENLLPFLLVNVGTQIFLTAVVGSALIFQGTITAYLHYAGAEIVILLAETVAFAFFLKGKKRARRIGYAITANAVSCALGFCGIELLYEMITRLA